MKSIREENVVRILGEFYVVFPCADCPASWKVRRWGAILLAICTLLATSADVTAQDLLSVLRNQYLDAMGMPSEAVYARAHNIAPLPGSESFQWHVVFRVAYRSADIAHLDRAQPVYTDCHLIRDHRYIAPFRAQPFWDGRVFPAQDRLIVALYTSNGEKIVGHVSDQGTIQIAASADESTRALGGSAVQYNPFTGQLWRPQAGGTIERKQRLDLPLSLVNRQGETIWPEYQVLKTGPTEFGLIARSGDAEVTLAKGDLDDPSSVKRSAGYSPPLGPGCSQFTTEPTTVFEIQGRVATEAVDATGCQLVLGESLPRKSVPHPTVQIDGQFAEWRSLSGVGDPQGDSVAYLQYNPDTDLLHFKVTNDDEYLYFYTRVAGRHGNTALGHDRYYFYVYIDADRNPATGYLPTRDDDCYYGVVLGDDCEAQFEFADGRFIKTFFGFAGGATEEDVLTGHVTLAPSWYSKFDSRGEQRQAYKVEYIRRSGRLQITEDLQEGTTEDIQIALSADGSECEMRAAMSGFLKAPDGAGIISSGNRIDLAAGVEASGRIHGHQKWGADSTAVIRGYTIRDSASRSP